MAEPKSIGGALTDDKRKVSKMGYTVNYDKALSYLYNPKRNERVVTTNTGDNSLGVQSYSEYYATVLGKGSLEGEVVNGFISEPSLQQAVCVLKPYMAFPVKCKENLFNVSFNLPSNDDLNSGHTLLGNYSTIPNVITDDYKAGAFKGENGNFQIGVALDTSLFCTKYFKHFYGNSDWEDLDTAISNLSKLANKKLLFAEVTLDIDGGKVLHAPVICHRDDPPQGEGSPSFIYIPCPLLLTEAYSKLGTVHFKNEEGKSVNVKSDGVEYPFINAGYEHKNASIRGLKIDFYEKIIGKTEGKKNLDYQTTDWKVSGETETGDKWARVRLYFDKERRSDVEETLNSRVPQSCEKVFGPLSEIVTQKLIDRSGAYNSGGDGVGEIYWEEGMCPPGITRWQYVKIQKMLWAFETGVSELAKMESSPALAHVGGKENWISYGPLQLIERKKPGSKPGDEILRISYMLKTYVKVCEESGAPPADVYNSLNVPKWVTNKGAPEVLDAIAKLKELWKDKRLQTAYFKHYATTRDVDRDVALPGGVKRYNECGFTTALGLYLALDAVNQGFGSKTTRDNYHDYVKGACKAAADEISRMEIFLKWRKEVVKKTSPSDVEGKYGMILNYIKTTKNLDLAMPLNWGKGQYVPIN